MGLSNRLSIQQQAKAALKNGTKRTGMHWGSGSVAREMESMLRTLRGATISQAENFLGESLVPVVENADSTRLSEPAKVIVKDQLTSFTGTIIAGYTGWTGSGIGQT